MVLTVNITCTLLYCIYITSGIFNLTNGTVQKVTSPLGIKMLTNLYSVFLKLQIPLCLFLLLGCVNNSEAQVPKQYTCLIDGSFIQDAAECANTTVRLHKKECPFFIGEDWPVTECFDMYVPENHSTLSSRTITFPIVLFRADEKDKSTPLLHMGGGGPGGPMYMSSDDSWKDTWYYYQDMSLEHGADLYVMDPRGLGNPYLVCKDFIDTVISSIRLNTDPEIQFEQDLNVYQKCKKSFVEQGYDLSAYNSLSVAKDVELFRKSIGVEKLNLYGVSYGSRYALTYARDFPDATNALVLDGAVFNDVRYSEKGSADLVAALKNVFQFCKDDRYCNKRHQNLEQRFWKIYEDLEKEPLKLKVTDERTYEPVEMLINGSRFLSIVFQELYDPDFGYALPGLIASVEKRNVDRLAPYARNYFEFLVDDEYADISSDIHFCYEEYPFINFDMAIKDINEFSQSEIYREHALQSLEFVKRSCKFWDILPGPQEEGEKIIIDKPVLFLHGGLDPVLPIDDIKSRLAEFKNSEFLEFEDLAHDIAGNSWCATEAAGEFFYGSFDQKEYDDC